MNVNPWRAGLVIAMFASVSGLAIGDARPEEMRYGIALLAEDVTPDLTAAPSKNAIADEASRSVTVGATSLRSQDWVDFRRAVADSAAPGCVDPNVAPHKTFAVEGLLRIPFLARAAVDGACR